ncbi:MAG: transporter substrate-binding domain-containing protein [Myxococcota bacterium]
MSRLRVGLLAVAVALVAAANAQAQTERLRVGAKVAPPFVVRGADGEWSGISVEAWRAVAEDLGLAYELVAVDLDPLFDGLEHGTLDVGIGALTVTAERETRVDFTHAIYSSGLGMAVSLAGEGAFVDALRRAASPALFRALGALLLVLLGAGALVWLLERRRNPQQFEGGVRGLFSGFWWSAVTMTTVGYGDKAPVTAGGRAVALVWMFFSIVTISGFTAAIASQLTLSNLTSGVDGPEDLPRVPVATVASTTSHAYLVSLGIAPREFASLEEALLATAEGRVQAVVYDRPLLQHQVVARREDRVKVLPHVLQAQQYALALAPGSPLREPVNRALLAYVNGDTFAATVARYLGE